MRASATSSRSPTARRRYAITSCRGGRGAQDAHGAHSSCRPISWGPPLPGWPVMPEAQASWVLGQGACLAASSQAPPQGELGSRWQRCPRFVCCHLGPSSPCTARRSQAPSRAPAGSSGRAGPSSCPPGSRRAARRAPRPPAHTGPCAAPARPGRERMEAPSYRWVRWTRPHAQRAPVRRATGWRGGSPGRGAGTQQTQAARACWSAGTHFTTAGILTSCCSTSRDCMWVRSSTATCSSGCSPLGGRGGGLRAG